MVIRACGVNRGLGAAHIDHYEPRGWPTWPVADIEVGGTPLAPRILTKALARTHEVGRGCEHERTVVGRDETEVGAGAWHGISSWRTRGRASRGHVASSLRLGAV